MAGPPDLGAVKLGKAVPTQQATAADTRGLNLPPPPDAVDHTVGVAAWPAFMNDTLGDCTVAAVGHVIQQWASARGTPVVLSDTRITAFYSAVSGYDGSDGTDRGVAMLDVLLYWQAHGAFGHELTDFTPVRLRQALDMRLALQHFGSTIAGLSLPRTANGQAVFDVPPGGPVGDGAPGSLGGHIVAVAGYDPAGLTIVAWGQTMRMTWAFWDAYCVEAYAMLAPLWAVDLPALRSVMAQFKSLAPPAVRIEPS